MTYFSGHPVGYIAYESMGVGDGADMGGKPLTILDSGEERVNAYTIQGFQEVEMPDGFEPTDEIDIELTVMYGMSVWAQDEKNVYHEYVMTPENRGFFRLPFKVKLNGQSRNLHRLGDDQRIQRAGDGSRLRRGYQRRGRVRRAGMGGGVRGQRGRQA